MAGSIQELIDIVQGPEVNVQRVEAQEAMALIAGVSAWQSPFVLRCMLGLRRIADSIHGQRAESWESSRVSDMYVVQSTVECILVWRSWIIGNLDSRLVLSGIVVDVQVGTLVKAMMERLWGRRSEVVMDVGKTMAARQSATLHSRP